MSKTDDQQTSEPTGGALSDTYDKVSDKVANAYSAARETAGSVG